MQTVCGRIKTTIQGAAPTIEPAGKVVLPGYLEDQPTGAEVVK
jgi:hypothetical protein